MSARTYSRTNNLSNENQSPQPAKKPTHKPNKVTCDKVTSLLLEYLNRELEPELLATFDAHIQGCDDCVAFLSTYQQSITAVSTLTYDDLPRDLQARTLAFIRQKTNKQ